MIANNIDLSRSMDDTYTITLVLTQKPNMAQLEQLKQHTNNGKLLDVAVKKFRKKRSLDSNSYAHLLIGKIADVLRSSKDEIYIDMLIKYGQREKKLVSVLADAADMIYRATNNHCYEIGESELNGKLFKHLAILIGSSQYNSREMSILIDGIVSDAKELGIETMSEEKIKSMAKMWNR